MKELLKKIIPRRIFKALQPVYHWTLAFLGAAIYRFPSRRIFVLGVTGTKGKTSVLEIINAGLEEAGYKTAVMSTLRFKIADNSEDNKLKMTMPGRFFVQKFLRDAVQEGCQYALLEMTSEGAKQFRHKFIDLDAMLFTNLSPEHIESHGSFENYRQSKLRFFKSLEKTSKKKRISIVNADDENVPHFLGFKADEIWFYGLKPESFLKLEMDGNARIVRPVEYKLEKNGIGFNLDGKTFVSPLLAEFNLYNILAAITFLKSQEIDWKIIKKTLEKFKGVPGRLEEINDGQSFRVIVDYAHTPDSLRKVYELFAGSRKICVLGAAGGGRDKWKRKEMGKIASEHCDKVILANEDPYDEKPEAIIEEIASGFSQIPACAEASAGRPNPYYKIIDRREAIGKAIALARAGDVVLITGKGTDPWIMGKNGTKIPWDDREVCREELKKIYGKA